MLDAFIIEEMKKQIEQGEWQPLPLTMELPNPDKKEEESEPEDDHTEKKAVVIRF